MTPMELTHLAKELAQEVTTAAGKLQRLSDLADDLERITGNEHYVWVVKEIREILND